jgi:ornithine cyclodeaminase/alanine dehydrogenase
MTLLLSRSDVMEVLDMGETLDILEAAFADLSNGKAVMPQRTLISTAEYNGLALFMPAYLKGMGAFGAKVVTVYKDNPLHYQMATVLGTIILLDEKTGAPLAIMDGGYLTAMRTGGVAGLASRIFARQEANIHALFGTGGMAKAHAWAVSKARDIKKLILYSVDPVEKRTAFAESLREIISGEITLTEDAESAVREADIVTLITSAKDPVIKGEWVRPGTHINGVGSHAPGMRELDTLTIQKSKVICDLVEACKAEAGDFIIPVEAGEYAWEAVHGSLGDVIAGKIPGRETDEEITLFKSVGLAIQDISAAFYVYKKALEMGVGLDFKF